MTIFRTCSPVLQEGPTPGSQVKGDCPIHTGPTARSKGFCPTHTGRGWLVLFFLAAMFQGISARRIWWDLPACVLSRIDRQTGLTTPLDYFSLACTELESGQFWVNIPLFWDGTRWLNDIPKKCQFQMREHRSNWWKLLGLAAIPFPGLSRNILRDATLAGWTDKGNPVLKQGSWCWSSYYEVVDVVRRDHLGYNINCGPQRANLTCLRCKQIDPNLRYVQPNIFIKDPIFVSSQSNRTRTFHLSSDSRDWLDEKFLGKKLTFQLLRR